MHILIVTDQHPDSLGGAQVAIRAQRASLERLGHRVSIAAPKLHRRGHVVAAADRAAYIELPSMPITVDREYGISLPGRGVRQALARGLAGSRSVDLVHVQGDFWGAMIGVRAARDLQVPLVFTLHNNVDQGTRAVTRLAPVAFAALRLWRSATLGRPRAQLSGNARGAWRYLAGLVADASAVIAPSRHFARELETQGVARHVDVVRGGADDALIADARALVRGERARPQLVWLGRMSHEKRVLECIEAFARSGVNADLRLFGAGLLLKQVREHISAAGLGQRITVEGPVPHEAALEALRDADALVQTSVGFETQGLTPFEAALLGTPTVFCDPAIAADVGVAPSWVVDAHASDAVGALAVTLREAVAELTSALDDPTQLRVAPEQSDKFLQSAQTQALVEIYQRVLA